MAAEDDNFFSRWSRRKAQVRSGEPTPAEPPPPAHPVARQVAEPVAGVSRPTPVAAPAEPQEAPPPLPTLDEAAALTPESDFTRFVARGVPTEVRNAAVKKLFADPHFNVMDGLDIYIDDYSKPSPLSAAMMAKMVGAQFLKLVDDPNDIKPPTPPVVPTAAGAPAPTVADTDAADASPGQAPAASSPTATTSDPTQTPHDDHADLQLQPDHAPERESPGRGAG